jgi:hypothetical protein
LEGRGGVRVGTRVLPLGALAVFVRGRGAGQEQYMLQSPTPQNPSPPNHLHLPPAVCHCRPPPSSPLPVVVNSPSLYPMERFPSSISIPLVMWKHCWIFTDIFCIVCVLDHTFDASMPSLYVWIPSEVLHVQH